MSMTKQLRWSGIPSILGGLVLPFAFLLHPTGALDQLRRTPYTLVHILAGTALLLLLLGLFGAFAREGTEIKRVGLLGLLIACIGTVFEIGYLLVDGFVAPGLVSSVPAHLHAADVHTLLVGSLGPVGVTFPLFELCFVAGYLMVAFAILDAHVFPRWTGLWLFGGALLFGPLTLLPPFVADLGAALLGLGFIEIGYILFFKKGERA